MNDFELRWVVPKNTNTELPLLMFRTYSPFRRENGGWTEWATVPTKVVKPKDFEHAKAGGNLP